MKANKVSALRSKRGLHRANGAEPQVVGLTPQTTDIRKTDTMKTYILRQAKPVEPQKPTRAARPQAAVATTTSALLGRPAAPTNSRFLFVWVVVDTELFAFGLPALGV